VSPPKVMYKTDDDNGTLLEPMEEVIAIVNDEHAGDIIESLTARRGELLEATPMVGVQGRQRLVFEAPARGLVGYRPLFAALTRGDGAFTRAFAKWAAHRGPIERARRGALIATAKGKATAYALASLEARGVLFIQPGDEIYEGMVVGESSRAGDLECNPVREKKLTNVRNTGSEEALRLSPAKVMTLEDAIGWINADEIMEVTPHSVRIRKTVLQAGMRRSENRKLVKQ
jgi:GTP-binding protein